MQHTTFESIHTSGLLEKAVKEREAFCCFFKFGKFWSLGFVSKGFDISRIGIKVRQRVGCRLVPDLASANLLYRTREIPHNRQSVYRAVPYPHDLSD